MIYSGNEFALNNFYEKVTSLVHFSEGRYRLTDVLNMIPWEFDIYLGKFSDYLDKINE